MQKPLVATWFSRGSCFDSDWRVVPYPEDTEEAQLDVEDDDFI